MNIFVKTIIVLLIVIINIFISYILVSEYADMFNIEFLQDLSWRQYWGVVFIITLIMAPSLAEKKSKESDGEYSTIIKGVGITLVMGVSYLLSLIFNWFL